jgi:hypothetical protein
VTIPNWKKHVEDAVTFAVMCVVVTWAGRNPMTLSLVGRFVVAFAVVKFASWVFWSLVAASATRTRSWGAWRWVILPLALVGFAGAAAALTAALMK